MFPPRFAFTVPGISLPLLRQACLLAGLAGCALEPSVENLNGTWANDDEGTIRMFTFGPAQLRWPEGVDMTGDLFTLELREPAIEGLTMVQAGSFSVDDGVEVNMADGAAVRDHVLVTSVRWSVDGATTGMTFGDPIDWMTATAFQIRSASADSGTRIYEKITAPP